MFTPNKIYRRPDLHLKYGGSKQSGISTLRKFPYIFIFTGGGGKKHGYKDAWDNSNVFSYIGEGQRGDMHFTKGNLALKNHLDTNKRVFLFEFVQKGYWRFIDELEYYDFSFEEIPDTDNNLRQGIRFFLKRKGFSLPQLDVTLIEQLEPPIKNLNIPENTERKGLVTTRVGHGAYRKRLIHRWEYKCAVTGFGNLKILIASHIVPWKDSTHAERLDVNNGILLSPIYDALFDQQLISFENSGKIILSEKLNSRDYNAIGVTGKEKIRLFNSDNYSYLKRHRGHLV